MSKIMTAINYPLIRNWHAALKSNKHMQGTGALEIVDKDTGVTEQCCLGVLCRVAMDMGIDLKTTTTKCGTGFGKEANASILPDEVALALFGEYNQQGLYNEHCDPYLKVPEALYDGVNAECCASDLNDNNDYTFEMIAAAIKATWPEAFTE